MVDVYAELVAILRALDEEQIEYALCGALRAITDRVTEVCAMSSLCFELAKVGERR
jgi:hypothetical protein